MRSMERGTDLGGSETLTGEFDDQFDHVSRVALQPVGGSAAREGGGHWVLRTA